MLFRKKRPGESSLKDEAAMKVVKLLLKIQIKFSEVMSSLSKKIPQKNLKVWLVMFCLFSGGSSIYLIARAIFKIKGAPALKVEGIEVPKYIDQNNDLKTESYVAPGSYEDLQIFRRYLDSLQQVKRDSILKKHLNQ